MFAEFHGRTPDQIADALPHLTLSQIHAALSYYFDHREAIQAEMQNDEAFAEQLRTAQGPGPLFQGGQPVAHPLDFDGASNATPPVKHFLAPTGLDSIAQAEGG